uniref:Uncharacterized protein n=1 Tax=Quercus lobata TaxID=97700 RepID=A0A7N2KRB6_QUELO
MGDVEYEDYEIVKFPFFYQVFPDAPTEPVKLPTVNYSDFGFPDLHITLPNLPKWTFATEDTNFEFVRLVKLQTVRGIGTKYYFQIEVKPSGAADHNI